MTPPIWVGTLAVFAVLMVAELVLTRNAVGLRGCHLSGELWLAGAAGRCVRPALL